jgi:molybdate transport repressor ModE-like protein
MPLSQRMPELGAFEVLLAVSRCGSLNGAAREVGVSQQAISARVASLEARTGVQLLTRTAQGSTLTASGVVVAEWADRLLREAADVDAGLAALRHDRRSRLRVSASLTIAEQLLPSWLVSFQAGAGSTGSPRVVLTAANTDHVLDDVKHGRADLGFIEGPTVPRGLRSRVVAHDELCLVVSAGHAWSRRSRPVGALELARTPLVTREAGSGTRDSLTGALRDALGAGVEQAAPLFELSTASAVRAAVLAEAAPAVMSRLAVAEDLRTQRLHEVRVAGVDFRRELRAIWLGERVPPVGAARDLLGHIATRRA